jgi:hypothetical protein
MSAMLSKQRRWQDLQVQLGNCALCGKRLDQAELARYCLQCTIKRRERQREKTGSRRRYNSASYRMWAKLNSASGLADLSPLNCVVGGNKPVKNEVSSCGDGSVSDLAR